MKRIFSTLLALTLCSGAFASSVQATDTREPMTIGESSSLPLRVLTRPNATLYADKSGSAIVQSNLPTFQSFFVYDKPLGDTAAMKAGWYEVGKDDKGTVVGWIKGEDVFEWKQTMCLTFAHPQDRKPVLMFDREDDLASLADMDTAARVEKANAYYEAIGDPDKPGTALGAGFPVVSIEPKLEVDKVKQFYLLRFLLHNHRKNCMVL